MGMSLRDYFAAHAPTVPDFVSALRQADPSDPVATAAEYLRMLVAWRWAYADAMVAARKPR